MSEQRSFSGLFGEEAEAFGQLLVAFKVQIIFAQYCQTLSDSKKCESEHTIDARGISLIVDKPAGNIARRNALGKHN